MSLMFGAVRVVSLRIWCGLVPPELDVEVTIEVAVDEKEDGCEFQASVSAEESSQ